MRYLIVCDYSLTFLGGAQTALVRQAEALSAQGAKVAIMAPDVSRISLSKGIEKIEPPKTATLPGIQLPLFRQTPKLLNFVAGVLDDFAPDAVLSHSEFALVNATIATAKALSIPTMHTVHTFFWHTPRLSAVMAPLGKAFYRHATALPLTALKLAQNPMDSALRNMTLTTCLHADLTISPSAHQAEKLRAAGVKNVEVVSNVTETKGTPSKLPAGKVLKLAWIGRFSPEKRLDVALDGVALAKTKLEVAGLDPKLIELHIAGGPARDGNDHVWHGTLTADGVSKLLSSSHALVMTSLGFDNQPMVILEAFAHARPVILCDPVLGKEFGGAALLSATSDAEGLASLLFDLVKERVDLTAKAAAATKAAAGATSKVHASRLAEITKTLQGKAS
jgi:glycosyltransferase involved in cell wall biosynthesis